MHKIIIPIEGLNPNKLHDELGDLGASYSLLHNESEIILLFDKIAEVITLDENEQEIKSYTIKVESQDIDGEGNPIEIINSLPFNMDSLKTKIDNKVAEHDPAPIKLEPSEFEKMQAQIDQLILLQLGV